MHAAHLQCVYCIQYPCVCMQGVRSKLAAIRAGGAGALAAMHQLASTIEAEEARYRQVAGDPWNNPSQRSTHALGRLLAIIRVSVEEWS